jgi:hypothetical protein
MQLHFRHCSIINQLKTTEHLKPEDSVNKFSGATYFRLYITYICKANYSTVITLH